VGYMSEKSSEAWRKKSRILTDEELKSFINNINKNMKDYDRNIKLRMKQSDRAEMRMQRCVESDINEIEF